MIFKGATFDLEEIKLQEIDPSILRAYAQAAYAWELASENPKKSSFVSE